MGVDVPLVAAVTLLRRFSRHRHDYQATGLASALYIKTAVEFLAGYLNDLHRLCMTNYVEPCILNFRVKNLFFFVEYDENNEN